MKTALVLAVSLVALCANAAESEDARGYDKNTIRLTDVPLDGPRFEDYPVSRYHGRNASVIRNPDGATRLYRTQIQKRLQSEPNFAGHFILTTWGCGTDCTQLAIIDVKTGTVFHPSGLSSNAAVNVQDELLRESGSIWHKANSKLLVVVGAPEEDDSRRGISYYVWQNFRLKLIRFAEKR